MNRERYVQFAKAERAMRENRWASLCLPRNLGIMRARMLPKDQRPTLQAQGEQHDLSNERIRQIAKKAVRDFHRQLSTPYDPRAWKTGEDIQAETLRRWDEVANYVHIERKLGVLSLQLRAIMEVKK